MLRWKVTANLQYEVHVVGVDVAQVGEESEAGVENPPEQQSIEKSSEDTAESSRKDGIKNDTWFSYF